VIRAERVGDEEAIHAVEVAAFGRDAEAKIADGLRRSDAFIPELSLVADEAGAVVGHVIVSRGHVAPSGEPILLLGPIGVLPERQGEGIGSALVEAALEGARRLGAPCVALLGSPAYYKRFGFVHAEPLGLLPLADWPSQAFQVAIVDPAADVPQGRVVYPPAFGV
jgi:putative acetyltransferase